MRNKNSAVVARIGRRLEAERWARRLEEKASRAARRRVGNSRPGAKVIPTRIRTHRKAPQVQMVVPPEFDLQKQREDVCNFVELVQESARSGNRVLLDFNDVQNIRPSALMYLLSHIHKLRLEHGDDCITGTYPTSKKVERLLSESGFYGLLKVRARPDVVSSSRTMRYIKFKSDQRLVAERIADVRKELLRDDLQMPTGVRRKIFRALSEAMTNVGHHAYRTKQFRFSSAAKNLMGRWWLVASLNVAHNRFSLVFYDVGVGIPKTLHRKYPLEQIRHALSLLPGFYPDDAQMIEAAMVLGRTRTNLENRGKGLLDLMQLIDLIGDGEMHIYSRNGVVRYTPKSTTKQNSAGFVEGTLIEWRLPLDKALVSLPEEEADEVEDEH